MNLEKKIKDSSRIKNIILNNISLSYWTHRTQHSYMMHVLAIHKTTEIQKKIK